MGHYVDIIEVIRTRLEAITQLTGVRIGYPPDFADAGFNIPTAVVNIVHIGEPPSLQSRLFKPDLNIMVSLIVAKFDMQVTPNALYSLDNENDGLFLLETVLSSLEGSDRTLGGPCNEVVFKCSTNTKLQ